MRFYELVLPIPGDELRVKFHPRVTVLSGLRAPERQAFAESILGALTGGGDWTALRYLDGTGRPVTLRCDAGGSVLALHEDGSPAPAPLGPLTSSPEAVRALMLVQPADLGVSTHSGTPNEPHDLREARASLEEINDQLHEARGEEQRNAALQAELDALDSQLRSARDNAARREYAQVLAQLERVRAEAATLRSGIAGIEADRHLLAEADTAKDAAARWREAASQLDVARERSGDAERLQGAALARATTLPDEPPANLPALVDAVADAEADRETLDRRLKVLAVAKLPAPSDLIVGELGLLDQTLLWRTANRLITADEEVQRVQVSLGGLGGEDGASSPAVIDEMEAAHRDLEEAERAAEEVRLPGVAGTGLGISLALAGTIDLHLLVPVGLLIAVAVGTITLLLPRSRVTKAAVVERAALERAGAPSYLGFHLRRVDATVDPTIRGSVETTSLEHRAAVAAWTALVGPNVHVHRAKQLDAEIQAYHDALRSLGGAADEIEQLRRELTERAEPAMAAARYELAAACAPFGLVEADLEQPATVASRVTGQIERGRAARRLVELEEAEAVEREAALRLDRELRHLGFDTGELDARSGALDWAVTRAIERDEARANARPTVEIDTELDQLQVTARQLRRPEWSTVTAADASAPDLEELEERREKLQAKLAEVRPEVNVSRLADRQAAIERRVAALEARHVGHTSNGDPSAVADIQRHLLGHLTKAAQAGPHGDAVPALLDEVFHLVPAERKWDLLDLLYRLSERHQLVYLSDDPFVAAWARQCPDGTITLLEPDSETV